MLEVKHITKYYGKNRAVSDLSFTVKDGEIFGLLGENGAGKTTTFRIIMGLIDSNEGEVLLDGKRIDYNLTDKIGFVTEERSLLTKLTVLEQLTFYGVLKGLDERTIEKDIDIRYYSIIYNIVDDIKNILSGMLEPVKKEEIMGHAEVRQVFKITGVGKVAGSFVLDGEISRNDKVRLIRDGIVIYSGDLKALKRFKDDVKEVKSGYECGISIDNYDDIKEKDIIESFRITEEKRSL